MVGGLILLLATAVFLVCGGGGLAGCKFTVGVN